MVLVSVWCLEHVKPGELEAPEPCPGRNRLIRVLRPSPPLALLFYRRIGDPCRWRSRLAWSDEDWRRALDRAACEWWLFWRNGAPVGFTELHAGDDPDRAATHIKYLGLLPDARGQGLGAALVTESLRQAWRAHLRHPELPEVQRVTVETSEWDSPPALPNYLARGFEVVSREDRDRPKP